MGDKARRIGLLGGSFDPVHLGHLIIAHDALEQVELDTIRFIPAARSPLKSHGPNVSGEARLAMLKLAISRFPDMELSDVELTREGRSYSVETMQHFSREEPEAVFYLIVGADQFEQLADWKDVGTLCRLCRFAVVPRPGHEVRPPEVDLDKLQWQSLEPRWMSIASTEIRNRIESGQTFSQFVDPAVGAYIETHQLYHPKPKHKHKQTAYGS